MREKVMDGKGLQTDKEWKTGRERKLTGCGLTAFRVLVKAGAIVGTVLLIGVTVAPLYAQSYPKMPIRLIVPFPPGGGNDTLARIVGPKLAERLGQPVVIENRPGAGGNVGTEFTARARADGYTIALVGTHVSSSVALYKKLNYDVMKDFAPISLLGLIRNLVLVHPSLPVKNLKELVEYARANPGKINFSSAGIGAGTHLGAELFKSLTKIDIVHVPYKGGGPALIGLMSGEVDMVVVGVATAMPQVQAGKVRALAVLSKERNRLLPSVPTAKESGIDKYEATTWYGVLVPAGTPRDVVNRLNAEWIKVAAMPDTKEKMQKVGFEPLSGTPEQFSEFLKAEIVRWAKVVREANIPGVD